jgi:hypothetical protein
LNPKPLFQCIAIPTPLYFFQVIWSGLKLFFDPLRLILYFPGLMRARRLRRTRRHRHRYSDRQDTHVHALSPLFHLSFLIVFIHMSSTISSISFLPLSTPSTWSRSLAQLRIALLIVFSACCFLQIPYLILISLV